MSDQIHTTLGTLVNAEPALSRLSDVKLPIKTAYQLGRLIRVVKVETADFATQRNALIQELGEERDATPQELAQTGQQRIVAVLPANYDAFGAKMQELASVPVELAVRPLTLEDLGSVELSARDLELLGQFVVDPSEVSTEQPVTPTKRREQKRALRVAGTKA